MSFDPNYPPAHANLRGVELRAHFNALHDENTATNQRIDNIPAGPPGANGADGRSINPRGTWSDSETYNRLDLVTYNGALYICTEDNTVMATPGSDPRWQAIQINVTVNEINGQLVVNGNIQNNGMLLTGGVGVGVSDPGGSGESGVIHGTDSSSGFPLPLTAIRNGGSTAFQIVFDYGGQIDGMGTPTIADGSIWRYDQATGRAKPWNVTVQTINYTDSNGNPASMQVIVPPV